MCLTMNIDCGHFSSESHKVIYYFAKQISIKYDDFDEIVFIPELSKLKMSNIPWVSKNSKLSDQTVMDYIGGRSVLLNITSLYSDENVSIHGEKWLKELTGMYDRREAIKRASRLIEDLESPNGKTTIEILADFESKNDSEIVDLIDSATANDSLIEKINKIMEHGKLETGIRSGIDFIDRKIGDIETGRFVVIGADPASGKTALATHFLTESSIKNGHNSLFFSLEMYGYEMMERLYAMNFDINFRRLKAGAVEEYFYKIKEANKFFKNQPIKICDRNDLSIDEVRVICRMEKRKNDKLKCIFIDHMALLKSHNSKIYGSL